MKGQAIKFHHYLRIIVEFLLGSIPMVNILNDCLAFNNDLVVKKLHGV